MEHWQLGLVLLLLALFFNINADITGLILYLRPNQ